jgi:hypothetical protein
VVPTSATTSTSRCRECQSAVANGRRAEMSTERERRYTVPPGPGVRSARSAHSSDRCSRRPDALRRRLAAVFALVVGAATLALAVTVAISEFPRGLVLLGCALVAGVFAWYGLIRRGIARAVGLIVAGTAVAVAVALIVVGGSRFLDLLVIVGLLVSLAAARATLGVHVDLPSAPSPRRPVLFFNPRSGGGKAERFALAKEARDRGIEPIELKPGDDLEVLVRRAVERGADGLAMAGGDGSQAVVAAIAAELGLPYACVPAGTRNHFALDLGVDREDVVGALDAFVDGGQRRVDLAEVNGRVFVNNVFAWPLRRGGSARRLPRRQDPHRARHRARRAGAWRQRHRSALDRAGRARTPCGRRGARLQQSLPARPRCRLGHPPADRPWLARHHCRRPAPSRGTNGDPFHRPMRQWSAQTFEIDSDKPVPAGVDGEALVLDSPLMFRIRPGVLWVHIAHKHPGASPSATAPEGVRAGIVELARIAWGHQNRPASPTTGRSE